MPLLPEARYELIRSTHVNHYTEISINVYTFTYIYKIIHKKRLNLLNWASFSRRYTGAN